MLYQAEPRPDIKGYSLILAVDGRDDAGCFDIFVSNFTKLNNFIPLRLGRRSRVQTDIMIASLVLVLLVIAIFGSFTSAIFLGLVSLGALRFRRSEVKVTRTESGPPLTLLKPVHGMEPRLEENLESFFRQDYPAYEIIFCARDAEDPALKIAEKLAKKYPAVATRILASGDPPWTNAKVYSLHKMAAIAKYETLVISDSDVRVEPNYLRSVTAPLANEKVGVVTCLYRGVPVKGFWALLEALGMSVEMTSGVLVANMLEGMKFALGPTMVVRAKCLKAIGGFARMADYCADDYLLGNLAAEAGFEVVLSHHVIDHIILNRSFWSSMQHQVRWMKSTRFSRPKGHLGTIFTFGVPFGVLGLLAGWAHGAVGLGIGLFLWAVLSTALQSVLVGWGITRDANSLRYALLYPVRGFLGFCLWCASYTSSSILWRGEQYRLVEDGRMLRGVPPPSPAQEAPNSGNPV